MGKFGTITVHGVDMVETGNQLKRMCKSKGISAKWLADALEISPQAVYSWYHGEALPKVEYAITLARVLEVHVEDLYVEYQVA